MYLEDESTELLELLSQVRAIEEMSSGNRTGQRTNNNNNNAFNEAVEADTDDLMRVLGGSTQKSAYEVSGIHNQQQQQQQQQRAAVNATSEVGGPMGGGAGAAAASASNTKTSTPFDKVTSRLLLGTAALHTPSPTSTHTTPAALTASPMVMQHLQQQQQMGKALLSTLNTINSASNERAAVSSYTLSQTVFTPSPAPLPSFTLQNKDYGGGVAGLHESSTGSAGSMQQQSFHHNFPAHTSPGTRSPLTADGAYTTTPAGIGGPLGGRGSGFQVEEGEAGAGMFREPFSGPHPTRAATPPTVRKTVAAASVGSYTLLPEPGLFSTAPTRTPATASKGSLLRYASGPGSTNPQQQQQHMSAFASLTEAFSTAAAEGPAAAAAAVMGGGGGGGDGASPLSPADDRSPFFPYRNLSSNSSNYNNINNAGVNKSRSTLGRDDGWGTAGGEPAHLHTPPLRSQQQQQQQHSVQPVPTVVVGLPRRTSPAEGGGVEGPRVSTAPANSHGSRYRDPSEPQPSLRPHLPPSKHTTPYNSAGQREGSAAKAKLNYYTLPSPPRPFLNSNGNGNLAHGGGGGGGGGGGPIPHVATNENSDNNNNNNSSSRAGLFMPSIAGRVGHAAAGGGAVNAFNNGAPAASMQAPYPRRPLSGGGGGGGGHSVHNSNNNNNPNSRHGGGGGGSPASPNSPSAVSLLPVVTMLIEAFRADGSNTGPHRLLVAKVLSMCRDQHGCRQLQNVLTKEIFLPTTAAALRGGGGGIPATAGTAEDEAILESFVWFERAFASSDYSNNNNSNNNNNNAGGGGGASSRGRSSPFNVASLSNDEKKKNYSLSAFIPLIVDAVQQNFSLVMADAYGNFLVQKIIEIAPDAERVRVLAPTYSPHQQQNGLFVDDDMDPNSFCRNIITIACSPHGTFALQRLIETIKTAEEEALIFSAMFREWSLPASASSSPNAANAFNGNNSNSNSAPNMGGMMRLFIDANGGHVLYKMTAYLKAQYVQQQGSNGSNKMAATERIFLRVRPFYTFLIAHLSFICSHRQGCCVVQKCIDFLADAFPINNNNSNGDSTAAAAAGADVDGSGAARYNCFGELAGHIIALTPSLATDPYGNYVVTHLAEVCFLKGHYQLVRDTFSHIHSDLFAYCRNKFASNVVEKLLRFVTADEIRALCRSLMITTTVNRPAAGTGAYSGGVERVAKTRLELLALDPFGNYVVQTLLGVAPVDLLLNIQDTPAAAAAPGDSPHPGTGAENAGQPAGMLWILQRIVPELKEKNFGKKMITRIDLALLRVREQQQLLHAE